MVTSYPAINWLIPSAVILAGFIGSPHCASMCGPLVVNFAKSIGALALYQLGRLLSYLVLGAMAGAFGQKVFAASFPSWITSISLASITALLFINGINLFRNRSMHLPIRLPPKVSRLLASPWRLVPTGQAKLAAFTAGLVTVFLPCGHLYSFVAGAVAAGSTWRGAGFMLAFWLGSAPLLSVGAGFLNRLRHRSTRSAQRFAGVVFLLAGAYSVYAFALKPNPRLALHDAVMQLEANSNTVSTLKTVSEAAPHTHLCH